VRLPRVTLHARPEAHCLLNFGQSAGRLPELSETRGVVDAGGVLPREGPGPLFGENAGFLQITVYGTVVPPFRAEPVGHGQAVTELIRLGGGLHRGEGIVLLE